MVDSFALQEKVEIPQNQNASVEACGVPFTQHCVWAQGIQKPHFFTANLPTCVHFSTDLLINETVEFLANVSAKRLKTPFYLFLSFVTPHAGGVGTVGGVTVR